MVIRRNCCKGVRCTSSSGFAQSISCLRCLFSTTSVHSGSDACFHRKFAFSGTRTCKQWKSSLQYIKDLRCIECFHMTSRRPYWCPKTMKRRPCWCPKPVLWEMNSFLMQTLSFVPINLHSCWPREWKHSIKKSIQRQKVHCSSSLFSVVAWPAKLTDCKLS